MSELKSYDLVDIQDYRGEVYLKSEADKLITHQKFKRCLAMAKMCGIMSAFEDGEWYAKWINKWYKRWLEIADKYKEEA